MNTWAMFLIVQPTSFVFVSIYVVITSDSFLFAVLQLSLISISLLIYVNTISMIKIFVPISHILISSCHLKESLSLFHPILHLSDISSSIRCLERLHSRFHFAVRIENELSEESLFNIFVRA